MPLRWRACRAAPRTSGCGVGATRVWRGWKTDRVVRVRVRGARRRSSRARIIELRRAWRRGPHLLAGRLGIAPSTVHAVLARHGLSRLACLDRVTGTAIRYERDQPGELVHIDVKKLGRVPAGGGWRVLGRGNDTHGGHSRVGYDYLHVAIDDHSRVAFVEPHRDERGEACRIS
jgi:Integrase core domain